MDKLYGMIEDALNRHNQSKPSDAFSFIKDNVVKDSLTEIDAVLKGKDDIYMREDFSDEALDSIFSPVYDKYGEHYKKRIEQLFDTYTNLSDDEKKDKLDIITELMDFDVVAEKERIEDLLKDDKKDELAIVTELTRGLNNVDKKQIEQLANSLATSDESEAVSKLLSFVYNAKKREVKDLLDSKALQKDNKDTVAEFMSKLTDLGYGTNKEQRAHLKNWLKTLFASGNPIIKNVFSKYEPQEVFSLFISSEGSTELKDIYPYLKDDVFTYAVRNIRDVQTAEYDPSIVTVKANYDTVKDVIENAGIDEKFITGAFEFDTANGLEPILCTIGGVPASKEEQDPLEFVYLRVWNEKPDGSYNASNVYKRVPTAMVIKQLRSKTPEYKRGMPRNMENKGKYIPLTSEQVRKVLFICMMRYKYRMMSDDIYSQDLLEIYDKRPDAPIILDALKGFVTHPHKVTVRRMTKNGKHTYYIFVPYEDANSRFNVDTGNMSLRAFNRLARQ